MLLEETKKRKKHLSAASAYLCGLCVEMAFTAENAEIRRGPQRNSWTWVAVDSCGERV